MISSNFFDRSEKKVFVKCVVKYSKEKMIEKLKEFNWNNINSKSVNEKAFILTSRLNQCVSEFVRVVELTKMYENKWYDNDLDEARLQRDTFYKAATLNPTNAMWNKYKNSRNVYQVMLKAKKSDYFERKLNSAQGNSKETWKILKRFLKGAPMSTINKVVINGTEENDSACMAKKMNEFFVNSIREINRSIPNVTGLNISNELNNDPKTELQFKFKNVSRESIISYLSSMKKKRDADFINPQIIIDGMSVLGETLQAFTNESLNGGEVPDIYKISVINPVPKVPKPKTAEEFRPINTLSTLEKLLETIVKDQLVEYVEKHSLLTKWQSGYRKKHSCEISLNIVISNWKRLRDKNIDILCVFLDLKRAFETIDRDKLLKKLRTFGINGKEFNWFESYLSMRKQRTTVNSITSDPIDVDLGVPQGSILGAFLFILYINDMPTILQETLINLFADDTLIYVYGKDPIEMASKLESDLRRLSMWFSINKLKLNVDKSKLMYIHSSATNECPEILVNGEPLEMVKNMKYLGVIIDNKLNMNDNLRYVCKKVARKIGFLGRISRNLTFSARYNVYRTIIVPHFQYCASLLYSANSGGIDKLQKLQNRALRIIIRCSKLTSVNLMLSALSTMSVKQHIMFATLKLVFKMKNRLVPESLSSICVSNESVHTRELRNKEDFRLPLFRKDNTQRMLLYNGLKHFNKLPRDIKCEGLFNKFVVKLRKFVIDNF